MRFSSVDNFTICFLVWEQRRRIELRVFVASVKLEKTAGLPRQCGGTPGNGE